jgi:hypothetical protein
MTAVTRHRLDARVISCAVMKFVKPDRIWPFRQAAVILPRPWRALQGKAGFSIITTGSK